ncbi:MAG TPA: cation:proton antiporter, partial [bacterium]|nr:cation:proton antiporter [bacterium]HPP09274.1 cation:proton antiporter [bacterium]
MGETFGFFLAAFITICFARPVAAILKIPTLVVYIVAGILFGPSGLNLVKNVSSLSYFYELGIILLMFSAGLELKITPSRDRTSVSRLFLFNMVIPSLAGFIYGFLISGYAGFDNRLFLSFYMLTLVGSPASEVVVQLFREFTGRMSHVRKKFFSQLIVSSVFSDLVSLFIFTIIFAFHISNELYGILKFFFFASGFFIVVFKGLPLLQEKLLRRLKGINTPEDETTILLMLVVIVVSIGAFLQVPAVVCAFFAGISLANIDINRMVRNNINFISSAIFVPIVFIIIGAKVDLNIFRYLDNFLVAVVTIAVLMLVRIISIYIASRSAMFSIRESLG